jgi:hypothetical protein
VNSDEASPTRAPTSSVLVARGSNSLFVPSSMGKIRAGQPPRTWRTRVLRIVSSVSAVHGSAFGPVRRALPCASCVQGSAPLRFPWPT